MTMNRFRHLIGEIHRRSLWQVLAIYVVGAWIGYEVILALFEGLGLPDWVPAFAIVLFIIGLPLALATAFVQEGLPGEPATGDSGTSTGPAGRPVPPDPTSPASADAEPSARSEERSVKGAQAASADAGVRPAPPFLTWSRSLMAGLLAFAALGLASTGFLGMRALGIGPVGTLVAKGELEAREPLVVADFAPLTGDTLLAKVVTEGLRADLAQSSFVDVADRTQVETTLERMVRAPSTRLEPGVAREVAQRLGLKAVVEGEVGRAGGGYLLTARVVTADSGRTLTTVRETAADSTRILAAIEGLSHGLRERVGESLKDVRASAPLARVTTSSLPALRRAVEANQEERYGSRPRGIRLMKEAVELDPGFAWAWRGLATMHYNDNNMALALEAAEKAVEHEDRLTDRERYEARSMRASIAGDLAEARRLHLDWIARDTASAVAHINVSDVAWNQGDWDTAARYAERAMELGIDDHRVAHWNLVVALLDGGRIDEARRAVARADSALGQDQVGTVRDLSNMVLAAEARYHEYHDANVGWQEWWNAARADRVLGRWNHARQHAGELGPGARREAAILEQWDRFVILGEPEAGDAIMAFFEALAADSTGVVGSSDAILALGLAVHGRDHDARRVRDHYLAGVPEPARWRDAPILLGIDAFLALHQGLADSAVATLRRARERTPWTAPVDVLLGRAYDTLGRPDSAIAAYTRYTETPWALRGSDAITGDVVLLVPTHVRLALLHEEAGDLDAAARHATEVVRLWGDADPALRDQLAAMRRILERAAAEN